MARNSDRLHRFLAENLGDGEGELCVCMCVCGGGGGPCLVRRPAAVGEAGFPQCSESSA